MSTGRIHSIQSFGTVDGPGVRAVVFMQGCPLRCVCCHNPETWSFSGGEETTAEQLCARLLRYRGYFGTRGGVTVSGGEPLLQAEFVRELFALLKRHGINTALDTSGCTLEKAETLLEVTDLVLLDIKYTDPDSYLRYTGCKMEKPLRFLELAQRTGTPVWIRQVIIPGLNDTEESAKRLAQLKKDFGCIERIELLPFRKLCTEKYLSMGIPFPLENTPEPASELMERLKTAADAD